MARASAGIWLIEYAHSGIRFELVQSLLRTDHDASSSSPSCAGPWQINWPSARESWGAPLAALNKYMGMCFMQHPGVLQTGQSRSGKLSSSQHMLVASCQWCAASCNMPMQPPPTTWALGANLAQQTFPVRLRIALKRLYLCHCQTSHSHLKKYSFNFGGSCLHCGNLKRSPWFDVELSLIKCN